MLAWLTDVIIGLSTPLTPAGSTCAGSVPVDITQVPFISVTDLRALLVPVYIASVPANDPWGTPYDYRLNVANVFSEHAIAVRSAGADAVFEGSTYDIGTTSGSQGDLVHYNAYRLRQPPQLDPVSRQTNTTQEIETLGVWIMAWVFDGGPPPLGASNGDPTVDLSLIPPISATDLALLVTPFYLLCIPEVDGWGNPYDYRLNADLVTLPTFSVRSAGADGLTEGTIYDIETFPADDLARDLVWSDGTYFRQPTTTRSGIFTDGFESATLWGTWSCSPEF